MRIFFIRHGEAMDDLENRFGGWYDADLSPAGKRAARHTGEILKKMGVNAHLILTSPLKRALQTAQEISLILKIPIETFVYLKERNTYGLLSGENKNEAEKRYPELVKDYELNGKVLGYESYDSFLKRVKELIKKLAQTGEKTIICITHGKLLTAILTDIIGKRVVKVQENCLAEIEIDSQGKPRLIKTLNIEFG